MGWLVKLFRGWVFDLALSWIARKLREDKALVYALKEYESGAPFLSIVRVYAANTETKEDDAVVAGLDEIEAELKQKPFKDFIERYLGSLKLPDFDGDPDDDITVAEAVDRIVEEAIK